MDSHVLKLFLIACKPCIHKRIEPQRLWIALRITLFFSWLFLKHTWSVTLTPVAGYRADFSHGSLYAGPASKAMVNTQYCFSWIQQLLSWTKLSRQIYIFLYSFVFTFQVQKFPNADSAKNFLNTSSQSSQEGNPKLDFLNQFFEQVIMYMIHTSKV